MMSACWKERTHTDALLLPFILLAGCHELKYSISPEEFYISKILHNLHLVRFQRTQIWLCGVYFYCGKIYIKIKCTILSILKCTIQRHLNTLTRQWCTTIATAHLQNEPLYPLNSNSPSLLSSFLATTILPPVSISLNYSRDFLEYLSFVYGLFNIMSSRFNHVVIGVRISFHFKGE